MKFPAWPHLDTRGVTITELIVAMVIITVGVLAGMASFKYVSTGLASTRLKTIATNLAQEKMEALKNKSYFQLLVTTSQAVSSGFNPNFVYDNSAYPPEVFSLWQGAPFTRSVEVDYASVASGSVSTIPYSSSDSGMKKISVFVTWAERGNQKKVELDSYFENPSVATLNTSFKGTITESGANVSGALIQVVGTPKWRGTSDAAGNYSFQVSPGSYTLVCSSAGYFSQVTNTLSVTAGLSVTWDFAMTKIATGTVTSSSVYTNPNLVISQVVASTVQADGFDIQYVELFNPTANAINIGSGVSHSVKFNATSTCGMPRTCTDVAMTYVSTFVAPGQYYLIANRSSFTVLGINYAADAYYTDTANGSCSPSPGDWVAPGVKRIIQPGHNGAVWLTDTSGSVIDAVGWNHNANAPPTQCKTSCIPFNGGAATIGLLATDQIVRFSSACAVGSTYGRAYDSGDNPNNFYYNNGVAAVGLIYRPFSAANGAQTVISGKPATSAYVSANDGNSATTQATNYSVSGPQGQSCLVSSFTLVGVATGTWKVSAVSGSQTGTVATVAVSQFGKIGVPNNVTSPAWPVAGMNYMALSSTGSGGYASGIVYGAGAAYTSRLSGILVGSSSGGSTRTDSQGFYFLNLSTGLSSITANYNSDNANYTTSAQVVTINSGVNTTVPDFHIAKGGFIRGYVTAGTGALPNISVQATLSGQSYQDTTDNTGYFEIFVATSPLAYTVEPDLDQLQSYTSLPANPLTATVSTPGSTVFAGTITVVGAVGTISGSVKNNNIPITTGVLIVASTAAVPPSLATVYASSAPAMAVFYSVSSQADGSYNLDVRSSTSTPYNMRAFYPVVNVQSGAVTFTSKTRSGVSVGAGATISGQDFLWP